MASTRVSLASRPVLCRATQIPETNPGVSAARAWASMRFSFFNTPPKWRLPSVLLFALQSSLSRDPSAFETQGRFGPVPRSPELGQRGPQGSLGESGGSPQIPHGTATGRQDTPPPARPDPFTRPPPAPRVPGKLLVPLQMQDLVGGRSPASRAVSNNSSDS